MATQRKRRNLTIIAAIILVVAIVLSSFVYLNSQSRFSGKVEEITIGLAGNEIDSLIYLAENQHYFSSNGLNVTIKGYVSGLAAINGLLNGEVDFATAAEFVLVPKVLMNESIRLVGSIDRFFNEYVVARTDKGINNVEALDGKRIGVALGTSAEFYLGRFLELNNMKIDQVVLVDIPPPQTSSALANGTVEAIISWEPYISQIKNLIGGNILIWSAQGSQLQYRIVACMNNLVVAHPELIERLLNSIAQAETYKMHNPEESEAIIQNHFNYSNEYIAKVWHENDFSLSLDQSLLLAMQDEALWLIQNNLTNATVLPNFLNYVYLDGLEAVKPQSVTIIK